MANRNLPNTNSGTDLLAQLPPIALPDAPGLWPLTPAWWILLTIVILLVSAATIVALNRWNQNRIKRESLALLQGFWQSYIDNRDAAAFCQSTAGMLRRFCLSNPQFQRAASLTNSPWLEQLNHFSPNKPFDTRCEQLLHAYYAPQPNYSDDDIQHLRQRTEQWLKSVRLTSAPAKVVEAFSHHE